MRKVHKVLLTGGAGFIGSNFVRFVQANRPSWHIVNFDLLTYSGNLENLADVDATRHTFVQGDVCDAEAVEQVLREHQIDAIVHMAAESHVDRSLMDATPFYKTNVLGTQTVVDALRRVQTKTGRTIAMVHVSTDEVYGSLPLERTDLKFVETMPLQPNSPYAASKASSDLAALAAQHTFNLDLMVTRCSNNFGPYQFPEKVIPLFVSNLMEGKKVPLYGDGLNVRDWLHVDDHAEAIITVLEKGVAGEAYNIGGNNERSNLELTHTILQLMGRGRDSIQPVADRLGHDRRYAIDARKIQRELGWTPSRSAWPNALANTVQWYQEHKTWLERIKSGV
ncbi:MAG: dTDP-glucose 4,6-dehydratase, partial [Phycisphaerae bacterium]